MSSWLVRSGACSGCASATSNSQWDAAPPFFPATKGRHPSLANHLSLTMSEIPYTQSELDQAAKQGQAAAAVMEPRTEMAGGDGVLERRIPAKLFHNAVRGHGVDPNDEGYWQDMERLNPWIKVPFASRTPTFRMNRQRAENVKPGNRFGKIKERRWFNPSTGKMETVFAQ